MKGKNYFQMTMILLLTACSQKEEPVLSNFKVDESLSAIEWKGSAPTHFHKGAFKLSGAIQTDTNGQITSGDFTIPIESISNFDLSGPEQEQLLHHLKSEDFFNMAVYPEARFHIVKIEGYRETGSTANAMVNGEFTMIGQTHSLRFPALLKAAGDTISTEATFKLNRLQWGMDSFNDPQQALYILPDVDITLKIYCRRSDK